MSAGHADAQGYQAAPDDKKRNFIGLEGEARKKAEHRRKMEAHREKQHKELHSRVASWYQRNGVDRSVRLSREQLVAIVRDLCFCDTLNDSIAGTLFEEYTTHLSSTTEAAATDRSAAVAKVIHRYEAYLELHPFIDEAFKRFDKNKNGVLERDELLELLNHVATIAFRHAEMRTTDERGLKILVHEQIAPESQLEHLLLICDKSHHDALTKEELLPALATWTKLLHHLDSWRDEQNLEKMVEERALEAEMKLSERASRLISVGHSSRSSQGSQRGSIDHVRASVVPTVANARRSVTTTAATVGRGLMESSHRIIGRAKPRPSEQALRAAFEHFDTDHDGGLSLEELTAVLSETRGSAPFSEAEAHAKAAQLLEQFDTNHDGVLQYEEFVMWWSGLVAK